MSSTVIKALRILELVSTSRDPLGATEVAKLCDLSKSNAYRMLRVLETEGFLVQDDDHRTFMPSLKIWELGNIVLAQYHFAPEAQGILRWLADETGEAIHLALYDNKQAVTLAQIESRHVVRAYTETGGRAPAYTVATGKAMLAFQPDSEVESICKSLQQLTVNTITQPQILRHQLAEVRQTGVAVNNEEWQIGVRGIAAPILGRNDTAILSVGICGPANRVTREMDAVFSSLLRRAADELSAKFRLSGKRLTMRSARALGESAEAAETM
ncbi:IclR family transcriptional regulator [Ruegeria pomeroyi]|nr:IclR family transcriptional regulator [Ruegeria pomeroyi]